LAVQEASEKKIINQIEETNRKPKNKQTKQTASNKNGGAAEIPKKRARKND